MVDLRTSLRGLEPADDTRTLLERLRNRRDLFAAIAAEIDDLLGSPRRASPVLSYHVMTLGERLLDAFVGAAVGAVLGAIAGSSLDLPGDFPGGAVIAGTAGAIAGAITGTHGRVIVITLAGFVLRSSVWAMADRRLWRFSNAAMLGAPIGAILGAIAGAIIKKKKGWT